MYFTLGLVLAFGLSAKGKKSGDREQLAAHR